MEALKGKDEKFRELVEVYNKLPKDVKRSYYTNRILEIVKNVKKQKIDIDKVCFRLFVCLFIYLF
jgi:uncharacterized protein YdcH (DUF465 family)